MNLEKSELIESIKRLNKQKPVKEGLDIQRALPPADVDAMEQHEEAQKQNAERRDPKNFDKDVKDLIQETASEESRYRHFDVADRKDLAKLINEANEKGQGFKISRSNKEGFRYHIEILNEGAGEFMKKEAGDPEINKDAFNKATDIGAASPQAGLGEAVEEGKRTYYIDVERQGNVLAIVKVEAADYSEAEHKAFLALHATDEIGEISKEEAQNIVDSGEINFIIDENGEEVDIDEESEEIEEGCKKPLEEELKVFTAELANFNPSERSKELWDEIKDKNKLEDLEYALDTLYPDGISDVALDDLLINEPDWIKDLIGLEDEPAEGEEENELAEIEAEENIEEPIDGLEDEIDDNDIEPVYPEDDEEDIEPIAFDDEDLEDVGDEEDLEKSKVDAAIDEMEEAGVDMDDEDAMMEYLLDSGRSEDDARLIITGIRVLVPEDEENIEPVDIVNEEKEIKKPLDEAKNEPSAEEAEEDEHIQIEDDDEVGSIAEGFLQNNFKKNEINEEFEDKTLAQVLQDKGMPVKEEVENDEEVVAIDDSIVENMLGLPKKD